MSAAGAVGIEETDHVTTSEEGPASGSTPGWRPDPKDPTRRRFWDGKRWSGLSVSADEPLEDPESATTPEGEKERRSSRSLNIALAVALVLVVVIGVLLVLGVGDDTPTEPVVPTEPLPTTVGDDADSDDDGDTVDERAEGTGDEDTAPNGEAPGPGTPGGATPRPNTDPTAECTVDPEVLLVLVEAHPPLQPFAGDLNVAEVRCAGDWATADVWATGTDVSLGVFQQGADGWEFVLLGSSEPCSGLDIPAETEALLGCDFDR